MVHVFIKNALAAIAFVAAKLWVAARWTALKLWVPSHNLKKNNVYFSLSAVSVVLIVVNFVDVFCIDHINTFKEPYVRYIVLCVPSAAIIILWIYIMLDWGYNMFKQVPSQWNHGNSNVQKKYREKLPARVGLVFGTLVAVSICQFIFLPLYALPQYRKTNWKMTYNKTGGLAAPVVLFTLQWDQLNSPELATDVVCSTGGVFGPAVECANTTLVPGQWSYGFVVNYTESVMLGPLTEFVITIAITVQQPSNLQVNGRFIPLRYQFIDPMFSDNIYAALVPEDDRYPVFLQYPWDSSNYLIVDLEQITVDDTVNSLNWSNYNTYPNYTYYDVSVNFAGSSINVYDPAESFCGNKTAPCRMSLRLQINSQSLISEIRSSEPGIGKIDIILDESAIVGGMSFLLLFLNMYMT